MFLIRQRVESVNYQVLARKWRPRNFEQLVGQNYIVKALTHALAQQRLHHAYLFTGTRGIGKTTIARILAKCLNCEAGISAHPCGTCSACIGVEQGRYVDLIEVDAASRTKVEDTRALLDNVIYAPSQGRFKLYLIDEVHMLSGHSFNALLKTLEEPPAHVKFLLATTDPQRIPATVLSRCLQFHLKPLSINDLSQQMQALLTEEKIDFEVLALQQVAQSAQGSVRDGLSLLEQAIAAGGGKVDMAAVEAMLGVDPKRFALPLLEALIAQDGLKMVSTIEKMGQVGIDFYRALDSLLEIFHAWSLSQMVPQAISLDHLGIECSPKLLGLATHYSPEQTQLAYQIALMAKRDLSLAPNLQSGFEMALLRMLCFKPFNGPATPNLTPKVDESKVEPKAEPKATKSVKAQPISDTMPSWASLMPQLGLTGLSKVLAQNCVVDKWALPQVRLILDRAQQAILNTERQAKISSALSQHLNTAVKVTIEIGTAKEATPAQQQIAQGQALAQSAQQTLQADPLAQDIVKTFEAQLEQVQHRESEPTHNKEV
jgi:DNA polymerase-3 subunit gamma/tau